MSPTAIIAASRNTTRTSIEERLMIKVGIVGMGGIGTCSYFPVQK
jgi:hypothetical protein